MRFERTELFLKVLPLRKLGAILFFFSLPSRTQNVMSPLEFQRPT
jgi:hypothetical protein